MKIWHSSLGKKYIMGISGFVLVSFIVAHMLGNLQVFLGPSWINTYGQLLHDNHEILWPARIVLLTMIGLHIWSAVKLRAENRAARPVGYADAPAPLASSYASRTAMMSGLIIAAFVIFHLLHYTLRVRAVNLTGIDFSTLRDSAGRPDIYLMLLLGFSQMAGRRLLHHCRGIALPASEPRHARDVPVGRLEMDVRRGFPSP